MEKLLVGVDGSENSRIAVKKAAEIANYAKAKISLITVTEDVDYVKIPSEGVRDIELVQPRAEKEAEEIKKKGQKILDDAEMFIEDDGILVEKILRVGNPADVICAVAEEGNYDLIVLGDKGLSGIARFFLGSITTKVVRYASTSVLVAKNTNK